MTGPADGTDDPARLVACLPRPAFRRSDRRVDLVRLVECCLQAPASVRYAVYFGVSDNTWRFWDLEPARDQIGYEPRDDAERWRMSAPAQG